MGIKLITTILVSVGIFFGGTISIVAPETAPESNYSVVTPISTTKSITNNTMQN